MKSSTLASERLRIDFYRARIQSLEEALRPFAESPFPYWEPVVSGFGYRVVGPSTSDIRRARRLLEIDTPPPVAPPRAGLCRFCR